MTTNELEEFDERISILEAELLILRQRRNKMIPFSKVPVELILRILKYAQTPIIQHPDHTNSLRDIFREPSETFQEGFYKTDLSWLKLTSSCKWVRDLVLNTPEIWRNAGLWIPGNVYWRELCIQRSAGLPPILHMTRESAFKKYDADDDLVAGNLLNDLLPSVGEAHLHLDMPRGLRASEHFIESMYGHCLGGDFEYLRYLSVDQRSWVLTDETFCGAAEVLTTLVLINVTIILDDQPHFRNLRNFMIVVKEDMPEKDKSDLHLFHWISSLKQLEVLSVQYMFKSHSTGQVRSTSVLSSVTLPKLRVLRLISSICGLVKLLVPFKIQTLTGLDISVLEPIIPNRVINMDLTLSSPYEDLIQLAVEFWRDHRSFAQPPDSLYAALVNPSNDDALSDDNARLSLRSTPLWQLVDNTAPFCFFDGPYIEYDPLPHVKVTALYLKEDRDFGAAFEFDGQFGIDEMPLNTIFVENLKTRTNDQWSTMKRLAKWLQERKDEGKSIRRLNIGKQATKRAQHEMQVIANALRTHQVIEEVEWGLK